jgi:tRNA 2-thiouridine synthesizing protein A
MTDDFEDDDSLPLRELLRLVGGACVDCRTTYLPRDAVASIALGFKNAPRCHACLSRRLGRDPQELRQQLVDYVHRRECFLKAWHEAERMETHSPQVEVDEMLFKEMNHTAKAVETRSVSDIFSNPGQTEQNGLFWNAGELSCGELVMELRIRLNNLPPGSVLQIVALDPAAPEDLPAWCRMSGHTLLSKAHPLYRIRRKEL